jgi:hypothetical protein
LGYKWDIIKIMERITKTLSLDDRIVEAIQEQADKEKRSFTRQVEVLLEAALVWNQRSAPVPEAQA